MMFVVYVVWLQAPLSATAIIIVFNAISTRTSTTVMTYLSNLSKVF